MMLPDPQPPRRQRIFDLIQQNEVALAIVPEVAPKPARTLTAEELHKIQQTALHSFDVHERGFKR